MKKILKCTLVVLVMLCMILTITGCGKKNKSKQEYDKDNETIANQSENNNSEPTKNTTTTNNVNDEPHINIATEEIKKALKDKNWINSHLLTDSENFQDGTKKLTFICLKKDTNNSPIIIAEEFIEGYIYCKSTLITYNNGKIETQTICDGLMREISVEPNKRLIKVTSSNTGLTTYSFSEVKNNNISFIEWIAQPMDENAEDLGYSYGTDDNTNKTITKEEFDNIKNKYDDSKFVSVDTELTDKNIDKYIK